MAGGIHRTGHNTPPTATCKGTSFHFYILYTLHSPLSTPFLIYLNPSSSVTYFTTSRPPRPQELQRLDGSTARSATFCVPRRWSTARPARTACTASTTTVPTLLTALVRYDLSLFTLFRCKKDTIQVYKELDTALICSCFTTRILRLSMFFNFILPNFVSAGVRNRQYFLIFVICLNGKLPFLDVFFLAPNISILLFKAHIL